ncbi:MULTISPECIES: YihY/virulence factor BrkB family protein [unclassified Sphingomonas]|uniref:YihY/virulence factor BrkB family protein n=1 Tax=unclassified Sphingomonas TaxID=196159 RepID=UPI001F567C93|nr:MULTISPECIES: YihY/virulence factor BrkB family protein [unclassified Sphingomonas]
MADISPFSPEERGLHGEEGIGLKPEDVPVGFKRLTYAWLIVKRVVLGVLSDGFIHAGNLAYLALLTVFPFFILAAVIASLFGQSAETQRAVASFLHVLPGSVADLLRDPIAHVLQARSGSSLAWLGGLVALWSVGSFVETIRDIFRRAYGVKSSKPFWHYRLSSMAVILVSVILAVFSFLVQGLLVAVEQFIYTLLPFAQNIAGWIGLSRLIPGFVMFLALFMLFVAVTPSKYRFGGKSPEWPGALFTTAWWLSITALLPIVLSRLADYDLTYGSLAGVIITLLFFFLVGLGIVFGAHLNAALAEPLQPGVETPHTDATTGTL